MLNLLPLLGWAALGVAVLLISRYVFVLLSLRGLRFSPAGVPEHIALDEIPAEHRRLLELAAPRLREFGFAPVDGMRMPSTLVSQPARMQYAQTWLHEASGAWAVVALRDEPEYGNLYAVSFYTFYRDAPHLFTTARRGHEHIAVHPDVTLLDTAGDLADQWRAHLARMEGCDADDVQRDRAAIEALERRMPQEVRAVACAAGLLTVMPDGTTQFTWRGARQLLGAYQRGMRELMRHPLAPALANGVDPSDPRAAELRASADAIAIGNALAAQRHDAGRRSKGLWLLATGLASLVLFGWQFDWTFAWVLMAVLLLHELGHLLVMRWAGYRDLQVFFIPLFGAIASGRHERVPAWKKMLVLLAGPVPGLVLGGALAYGLLSQGSPAPGWLYVVSSMLIVVNLFNLLPFVPLDGGRLLDLLLLERVPHLSSAFAALSAFALVLGGLWLASALMSVLGCVLVFALPTQARQARLLAALRRAHRDGLDEEGLWLRKLSGILAATAESAAVYGRRVTIARSIAAAGMNPPPPPATVAAGLLLYGASLLFPLWMLAEQGMDVFPALRHGVAMHDRATPQRDYERELSIASSDTARFEILFAAASIAEAEEDFARAHDYHRRAAALAGQQAAYRKQRVEALIGALRSGEDSEVDLAMLEDMLPLLVSGEADTRLQRASVLSELGFDFSTSAAAGNLTRAEEVVTIRAALLPGDHPLLLDARRAFAWRLWRAERGDEALAQLRARAQALNDGSCDAECETNQAWTRRQVLADLGWLLITRGQPEHAARLAQDYPALRRTAATSGFLFDDTLAVLDAWSSDSAGRHADAIAGMQALLATDVSQRPVFAELQWLVDIVCFAERSGDRALAEKWTGKLRKRAAALRAKHPRLSLAWMRTARDAPYTWHAFRLQRELAWLETHEPGLLKTTP